MSAYSCTRKESGTQSLWAARLFNAGFTLIELMVTIAIVAILIAVGAPSFQNVVLDNQMSTQLSNLRKSLVFARSEAIKRAQHVSVCARATDSSCGDDWSDGWIIYTDADAGSPGTIDSADSVLRLTDLSADTQSIQAYAVVRPAPMQPQKGIRFSPRGQADWSVGTLLICDDRGDEHALGLIVNGAGSLRSAYADANSGGVVLDAVGNAADCA